MMFVGERLRKSTEFKLLIWFLQIRIGLRMAEFATDEYAELMRLRIFFLKIP